jgi:polar amino acid transport system ATP-binding protein
LRKSWIISDKEAKRMAILEVKNIEKHFENTKVLNDVSFSLEEGNALAIIGSSGSGKTTLLRCLNFLETPDRGTISVRNQIVFDATRPKSENERDLRTKRLHFGMVFQSFNLFPQYTALENVTLAEKLLAKERPDFKQRKKEIYEEIDVHGQELLAQMGLSERAGHYPHQLSGGQQQRVAIARALALKPDILCFDEPTSALDPELTGEVLKVIRGLAELKTTMIIVTHEMAFARDVADQVIFMDGGFVVEQGEARAVIDHPQEERTKQFLSRYTQG